MSELHKAATADAAAPTRHIYICTVLRPRGLRCHRVPSRVEHIPPGAPHAHVDMASKYCTFTFTITCRKGLSTAQAES